MRAWIALIALSIILCSYVFRTNHSLAKGVVAAFELTENFGKVHPDPYNNSRDSVLGDLYFKNRAYYFDGTSDYISCPFNARYDITNKFSFSVWAKPDNLSSTYRIIFGRQVSAANNSTWALTWELVNDNYSFYTSGQTGTSPYGSSHMAITDTRWHHIVYTYNGATFTKYLDGVVKGTSTITFSLAASSKPMTFGIGDSGNTPTTSFVGSLAVGIMWNRPLTADEVRLLYIKDKPYYNY